MTTKKSNAEQEETKVKTNEKAGDKVIFPEGPTRNKVEEWKSLYGSVFMTEVDEDIFVWRTITRTEYKEILKLKQADALYREERICEKCVLWPEDYDFLQMGQGGAGVPSLLAEQVMDKSGFTPKGESQKL